jgi:predicted NUDIX family NTP pyrophosphohydrolase
MLALGEIRQANGKVVSVWAIESDLDLSQASYGTFTMEWPRGSGRIQEFPELDRAEWVPLEEARDKLVAGQRTFLDRLTELLQA